MKLNKRIIPFMAMSMLIGSVTFGIASSSAHSVESDDFQQRLSTKLGVEKEAITSAIEEVREEKSSERRAELESKLQAKVDNDDLSQDQVDEFLALMDERREDMVELKSQDLSKEEFRNELRNHKQVLVDWANENQVELSDLIDRPVKPNFPNR